MSGLLNSDRIMNGLITDLIEKTWEESKKNKSKLITSNEIKDIHEAIVKYNNEKKEVFDQLAININTPIKVRNCTTDDCIEFFKEPGFILEDNIHAANGRFNYIYRAKGERSIWFKNGIIRKYTIYSTIDENGFSLTYEEIDSLNLFDSKSFFYENHDSIFSEYKEPSFILNKLLNINKSYYKDYYLEYLINPPDVQILSDYSLRLREEIWDSILELGKNSIRNKNEDELDLFKFCVNFMKYVNSSVQVGQIIDFFSYIIENKHDINLSLVLNMLEELKNCTNEINSKIDLSNKSDIIDIRPNIWGVGINVNEIVKRVKNSLKEED